MDRRHRARRHGPLARALPRRRAAARVRRRVPRGGGARARGASAAAAAPPAEAEIDALLGEVDEFVVVDHLFWGLWAVNQEASEGCAEHDYLHYATVRLGEFWRLEDARAAPTSGT